jgi:hypothetical protein
MTVRSDMLFWVTGSNNDINVLNQSSLFANIIRGHTPEVSITINEHEHHMWYYLTDSIEEPDKATRGGGWMGVN